MSEPGRSAPEGVVSAMWLNKKERKTHNERTTTNFKKEI
jgi:hypothetical protein